jgi:hypothetical protein
LSVLVYTREGCCYAINFRIRNRRLTTSVRSFGNGDDLQLTIRGKKIFGRVDHLGALQSFSGVLKSEGRWNGRFSKQMLKEKVNLLIRRGRVSHRRMRRVADLILDDYGVMLSEGMNRNSKESKRRACRFQSRLTISPKSEVCGFLEHKSRNHYIRIEFVPGGKWNAKGGVTLKGGKFVFSAKSGKCQSRFEGEPQFEWKAGGFKRA